MAPLARVVLLCAMSLSAGLDLNHKADLARVIAERAKDGQVMLYTLGDSDTSHKSKLWRDMAVELAYELESRKYPYVLLTPTDAACEAVKAASDRVTPYCVTNSVVNRTHGYNLRSVETLWVQRYHGCTQFAEAGVGCTLLDADTIINQDFLPLIKLYERDYSLIILREGGSANGGLWHLRASEGSGAGLWVIKQVERRSTLYEKFKVHSADGVDPGMRMDQDILGDVMRVAGIAGHHGSGNASAFDFQGEYDRTEHKDHEFWTRFPQKASGLTGGWLHTEQLHSSPFLHATCPYPPAQCARLAAYESKWRLRDVPLEYTPIAIPFDSESYDETAPAEKMLSAPNWLFSHGDVMAGDFDDQVAVVHLLYVDLQWKNVGQGSHVGRYVQWLARPGVHTFVMPPATRYLRIAQPLVDAAANHKEVMRLKHVIKGAAEVAAAQGRIIILPPFSCESPWIHTAETNRLGIEDHRVVIAKDGLCYPAPAGWNSCFPGVHFVYPFMVLGEGAQEEVLSELPKTPPAKTAASAEIEKVRPLLLLLSLR